MPYRIYPLGDQALCIDWGNRIDEYLNQQVLALRDRLRQAALPGVSDLVPAYSSLTIVFDLEEMLFRFPDQSPYAIVYDQVKKALAAPLKTEVITGRQVNIPVCYDPGLAPDLEALALAKGMSIEEVIQLHTGRQYRVFMLGFLPGFPYLGTIDPKIATPRLAQPRPRVPAGSVGIAGAQTGIYPQASPGGWNLIGRTPLRLFDAERAEPALLHPGDQVRFYTISLHQFHHNRTELWDSIS